MPDSPDLGKPSSYVALAEGVPVYAADGTEVGSVAHVLADPEIDIFDGLVLGVGRALGGHRYVDAEHVDEIFERGVVLTIDADQADELPEPTANPAALRAEPGVELEGGLERKLRRAWEMITGKG